MTYRRWIFADPRSFSIIHVRIFFHRAYTWRFAAASWSIMKCTLLIISLFSRSTLSPGILRSYLNGRNNAWKWPKCLPDGEVEVRSFQDLYQSIILSLVISISNSSFNVLNISSKHLLAKSSVIASILAVPSKISSAIFVNFIAYICTC